MMTRGIPERAMTRSRGIPSSRRPRPSLFTRRPFRVTASPRISGESGADAALRWKGTSLLMRAGRVIGRVIGLASGHEYFLLVDGNRLADREERLINIRLRNFRPARAARSCRSAARD